MPRIRTQPEDHVYWTQYRFLPEPRLYMDLADEWLDIAGISDFDIQDGYRLEAPNAIPAGCQAAQDKFFGVANVPREWDEHERINEAISEILKELRDEKVQSPQDAG